MTIKELRRNVKLLAALAEQALLMYEAWSEYDIHQTACLTRGYCQTCQILKEHSEVRYLQTMDEIGALVKRANKTRPSTW